MDVVRPPSAVVVAMTSRLGLLIAQRLQVGQRPKLGSAQFVDPFLSTGISSQIRTNLRDWAVWQARAGCYSQAALSSNDSKTLY